MVQLQTSSFIISPKFLVCLYKGNMAKSQGAKMAIIIIIIIIDSPFTTTTTTTTTTTSSSSIHLLATFDSIKKKLLLFPACNQQQFLYSSIAPSLAKHPELLLSIPCLLKACSKMAGRRSSLLVEVLREWSVISETLHGLSITHWTDMVSSPVLLPSHSTQTSTKSPSSSVCPYSAAKPHLYLSTRTNMGHHG